MNVELIQWEKSKRCSQIWELAKMIKKSSKYNTNPQVISISMLKFSHSVNGQTRDIPSAMYPRNFPWFKISLTTFIKQSIKTDSWCGFSTLASFKFIHLSCQKFTRLTSITFKRRFYWHLILKICTLTVSSKTNVESKMLRWNNVCLSYATLKQEFLSKRIERANNLVQMRKFKSMLRFQLLWLKLISFRNLPQKKLSKVTKAKTIWQNSMAKLWKKEVW